MNTNLRGIDPDLWRQLRAQAALRNLPLGTLVNQAIGLLLDRQNGRATSPQPAPESSASDFEFR